MSGCCAPASAVAISRVTSAVSAAGSTGLNCAGSTVYGWSGSSITSRGPTRYTGPAGSLRAICRARWTSCLTLRPVRISLSYLTKPRRMPRWSLTSWIQWMNSLRLPGNSPSRVYGEAPAKMSTGMWPRIALLTSPPRFWVPPSTCTTTAWGWRVTLA